MTSADSISRFQRMHRRVKAKLIIEFPVEKKGLDLGYDD